MILIFHVLYLIQTRTFKTWTTRYTFLFPFLHIFNLICFRICMQVRFYSHKTFFELSCMQEEGNLNWQRALFNKKELIRSGRLNSSKVKKEPYPDWKMQEAFVICSSNFPSWHSKQSWHWKPLYIATLQQTYSLN